jgi:hypothetical protein
MAQAETRRRTTVIYLAVIWMVLNLLLLLLMIQFSESIYTYIEVTLWVISIVGLLTMTRIGAATSTVVLAIALITSISNIYTSYLRGYTDAPHSGFLLWIVAKERQGYINALRVTINAALIVYISERIFAGKFK